jgi:hypothetical protein
MISDQKDVFITLHITGLLLNFATLLYIVTNFNIKVHVYTLLFIDSLICMLSSLGLIILDTLLIYGIWNSSFVYCNTWFFTLLLPTYFGGILTFLVAAIRYILALKAAKNIQPSNKTVSCWSLSFFVFWIFVAISIISINLWLDIPIAMMVEACASSPERPPRLVGIPNNVATRSVAIFNFLSLVMDVLVVKFIKKTILPMAHPPLELFDGSGQLPVGIIEIETKTGTKIQNIGREKAVL